MKLVGRTYLKPVWVLLLLMSCLGLSAQDVTDDEFRITPDSVLLHLDSVRVELSQLEKHDTASVDTASLNHLTDSLALEVGKMLRPAFKPDPIRALWLSLILPGSGQIYNRKYWKLPIVYGGFLGCAYALTWNNQMLRDYSQAYLDIMDSDPNTKSYEKMLPIGYDISSRKAQFQEIFKNKKNYYRKYRDMSIMAFGIVYAIAAIDAYVDAELSSFDISEDLSLQWTPAVFSSRVPGSSRQHLSVSPDQGYGVAFKLNF